MSAYLLKRDGGTYYFRRSIPLAQRQRFSGKREWVRSLGTKDRSEAKRLIPACLIAFDKAMDGDASKASEESHAKPFQPPVALAEAMEPYNWPAAGLMDTEIRCFHQPESIDVMKEVQTRAYGTRRVWHDVLADAGDCGPHRVERLKRQQGLRTRRRRHGPPKHHGEKSVVAANVSALRPCADYIERFYNPIRRHATPGYLSPIAFERRAGIASRSVSRRPSDRQRPRIFRMVSAPISTAYTLRMRNEGPVPSSSR